MTLNQDQKIILLGGIANVIQEVKKDFAHPGRTITGKWHHTQLEAFAKRIDDLQKLYNAVDVAKAVVLVGVDD